jgi:serine/threonine protein kinase
LSFPECRDGRARRRVVYTQRVEAGRRIGKYVLDERIAVGGMAEVWAAHAVGREGFVKPVALKLILESFAGDPELERLFVNEARIAARLQHANLVSVFDFDKVDPGEERGFAGRYYIAMERIEGHDLRHISEAARRAGYFFPAPMVLYVAGEVLKALRYVHEKREAGRALGLVHRDVSPHNVLVGHAGEVKLSDFGIAKAREHSARTTKPGSLRGKIAYASPEQLNGAAVDHRADQFAAGVTLWELLAGRRLFEGATDMEILGRVARCDVPSLREASARRDVPPAVEAALRCMLAADPGARFPTTADALAAVLALPGYTPDGAALGELVRTLFRSAMPELSHTLPIQAGSAPPSSRPAADAPTRTMHQAPVAAPEDGSVSGTEDVRSRPRVTRVAVVGLVVALVAIAVVAMRGREDAPTPEATVVAAPAVEPAPPSAPAPAPVAPPPVAPEAPPVAPEGLPTVARAPESPEPRRAPKHVQTAGREVVQKQARAERPVASPALVQPPAAAPPRAAERPVEAGAKRSANGAPIIE